MDAERFDTLSRSLITARSRRSALGGLLLGSLGLLSRAERQEAIAHSLKATCKKKSGDAKKKCIKKAKKHDAQHAAEATVPPASPPPPPVCTPSCTNGRTCQNGTCACPPGTRVCLDNSCGECCLHADCCNGAFPCPAGSPICLPPANGKRVCGCPDGQQLCGGACVDITRDRNNCGSCGNRCKNNYVCEFSKCWCLVAPC